MGLGTQTNFVKFVFELSGKVDEGKKFEGKKMLEKFCAKKIVTETRLRSKVFSLDSFSPFPEA